MKSSLAICAIFSVLAAGPARAGDISVLANGHAWHLEHSVKQKNENNYGFGLEYDLAPKNDFIWYAFGSEFRDSRSNPSEVAGGGVRERFWIPGWNRGHVDVGLAGMLMSRQTYQDGQPFPAVLPVATIAGERFGVDVTYIPKVDPRIIPLVFFDLKYKIN